MTLKFYFFKGSLQANSGQVITGSTSKNLRLWTLPTLESMFTHASESKYVFILFNDFRRTLLF